MRRLFRAGLRPTPCHLRWANNCIWPVLRMCALSNTKMSHVRHQIFLSGARHYEKPSTGYSKLENILLSGAYVAFSVIPWRAFGDERQYVLGILLFLTFAAVRVL